MNSGNSVPPGLSAIFVGLDAQKSSPILFRRACPRRSGFRVWRAPRSISGSPGRATGKVTNFKATSCSSPPWRDRRTGIRLRNCAPSGSETSIASATCFLHRAGCPGPHPQNRYNWLLHFIQRLRFQIRQRDAFAKFLKGSDSVLRVRNSASQRRNKSCRQTPGRALPWAEWFSNNSLTAPVRRVWIWLAFSWLIFWEMFSGMVGSVAVFVFIQCGGEPIHRLRLGRLGRAAESATGRTRGAGWRKGAPVRPDFAARLSSRKARLRGKFNFRHRHRDFLATLHDFCRVLDEAVG